MCLVFASENGHLDMVRLLVETYKVSVNDTYNYNSEYESENALISATQNNYFEVVKFLLSKGANPNVLKEENNNEIVPVSFLAVRNNNIDILQVITSNPEWKYQGCLIYACVKNKVDIIRFLLPKVENINHRFSKISPLQGACLVGSVPIINILLDTHQIDWNFEDGYSLFCACNSTKVHKHKSISEDGYPDIVQLLLENGSLCSDTIQNHKHVILAKKNIKHNQHIADLVKTEFQQWTDSPKVISHIIAEYLYKY